jgi:hypothetical protein
MKNLYAVHPSGVFPVGVFTSRKEAELTVSSFSERCTLVDYPIDIIPFEFDIENGLHGFSNDRERTP